MRKKRVDPETGHELDEPVEDQNAAFNAMVDAVACATKKLCDAGMGAETAGKLASDMYCRCNGHEAK